ncbi:MAG: alpha/beta fold hydrolase [Microbacteriaceae bacterium]
MTHSSEFRFLHEHAERVNRLAPLPKVERKSVLAPSGRRVSALVSNDPLARGTEPVVFLHGAGLNAHTFDATVLALEENTVSIDLPGHGRSDWRDDADYSPTTVAADVAATIASLTSGDVHLVGQSLGGLTAAALIPLLHSRLRTVTLIDITPGFDPARDATDVSHFISGKRVFASYDEMVDRAIAFGLGSDRAALTREIALNARERSDGRVEWSHHFAQLDGLDAAASGPEAQRPFEGLWQHLASLGARVTGVRGAAGLVTDQHQSEWRNRLPEAEMITLQGGHNVQEAVPTQLGFCIRKIVLA